jgi:hypothetical protein
MFEVTADLLDLIKITRKQVLGLSQRQAGLAAGGMSEVYWRTIESGRGGNVPIDTVARMVYSLDITPQQLRHIGQPQLADLVERRRSLLEPETLVAYHDVAEEHLMHTPGATDSQRAALVTFWRTLQDVTRSTGTE